MSDSALIFLHISKTGGTTLRSIIQRQYAPETIYDLDASYFTSRSEDYDIVFEQRLSALEQMSDVEKSRYQCFFNPLGYGLHHILPQSAQYVTMLRDPVDHYISNYYFAVNKSHHVHHAYIKEQSVTLDNYHEHFEIDNLQTRRLYSEHVAQGIYNNELLPVNALETAKRHLEQMAVIGLMEEFDCSVLMMQQVFGWQDVCYQAKNVAPKRKSLDDLNPHTRSIITEQLGDDMALYAYAEELFAQQLTQVDLDWDQALAEFRGANARYNQIQALKSKIRGKIPSFILKALGK
ncbi:MAG: sulfotransferase family 2 domain-containing protein [Anaerolineae bacterium]